MSSYIHLSNFKWLLYAADEAGVLKLFCLTSCPIYCTVQFAIILQSCIIVGLLYFYTIFVDLFADV